MSARGWQPVYEDGVVVEMTWDARSADRPVKRCPRTWPHEPHSPWHTGQIMPAGEATAFDCPGVPLPVKP